MRTRLLPDDVEQPSTEWTPLASGQEHNVGLMVRYTFRSFTRILQLLVAPHGLTSAEFRVMRTLSTEGELTQLQIAARAGMDRPYAALIVKRLRAKALVHAHSDARDGRRVNNSLSPRGREITGEIADRLAAINKAAIEGVSPADYAAFTQVIERIRANLDQLEP